MASLSDSVLLLKALPPAATDFVRDRRVEKQTSPSTAGEVWKARGGKLGRLASLGGEDISFPSRVSKRMGSLSPRSSLLSAELTALTFSGKLSEMHRHSSPAKK